LLYAREVKSPAKGSLIFDALVLREQYEAMNSVRLGVPHPLTGGANGIEGLVDNRVRFAVVALPRQCLPAEAQSVGTPDCRYRPSGRRLLGARERGSQ